MYNGCIWRLQYLYLFLPQYSICEHQNGLSFSETALTSHFSARRFRKSQMQTWLSKPQRHMQMRKLDHFINSTVCSMQHSHNFATLELRYQEPKIRLPPPQTNHNPGSHRILLHQLRDRNPRQHRLLSQSQIPRGRTRCIRPGTFYRRRLNEIHPPPLGLPLLPQHVHRLHLPKHHTTR